MVYGTVHVEGRMRDAGLRWSYFTYHRSSEPDDVVEVVFVTDPQARTELREIRELVGKLEMASAFPNSVPPMAPGDRERIGARLATLLGWYPEITPPGPFGLADYMRVMAEPADDVAGAQLAAAERWATVVSERVLHVAGNSEDSGTPLIRHPVK